MHERVCGESAHALVRSVARVAEVVEVVLERRVRSVGVDARHIREEVVDRDRPGERCEHHPPVLDAVEDLHVGELGDVARDRVVESQLAGFDQHQRADAGDRLRGDAEDRVRLHRQAGFDVALADAGELGHLVMSCHQHDGPGDLASLDASSDVRAGALKPWARQAHVLGGHNALQQHSPAQATGIGSWSDVLKGSGPCFYNLSASTTKSRSAGAPTGLCLGGQVRAQGPDAQSLTSMARWRWSVPAAP